MKIIQNKDWPNRECQVTVAEAISGTIDDAAGDSGIAEMGNEKASKIGEILALVIENLHKRNLLTDSEITDMLGWRYTIEED